MNGLLLLLLFPLFAIGFDWQGHRGARGLYPENTIHGMKEALKYPIDTLELDVVISKDDKVIVSHEPWMSEEICFDLKGVPVQEKKINLYKLNYAEIKKYDCGSKIHPRFPMQRKQVEHKPLLKELLLETEKEMMASGRMLNYSVEIKSGLEDERDGFQPEYQKFSELVLKDIQAILPNNRFIIQSFDWRVLKYIRTAYPQVHLVALRETPYEVNNIFSELGFVPDIFSPDWNLLSSPDVAFLHKNKVKVIPWTVNSVEAMKKVIAMGVDGIITDYPNLIQEIPKKSYSYKKYCGKGLNRFEGKCVKVPRHADPSENNPGWTCKSGYIQKRNSCEKVSLPAHALFSEDGKTWVCKKGFKRYRFTCEKI
jgi:glycerophosphoryl diester phosphodiesterase